MSVSFKIVGASALSFLLATVHGHGLVTNPTPRLAGPAFGAACGGQMLSQQTSDRFGNIQGQYQVLGSDFKADECNLWLCKGYQFDDNSNVETFTAGQTVPITVDIRAPHTGTANVSIVDTATNRVIGSPLISWDEYAANSSPIPDSQKNFDITIPTTLGSQCSEPGACVIQWFWDARSIDQTYEACIDFTVGGSGSGSPNPVPSGGDDEEAVPSTTAAGTASATTTGAPAASTSAGTVDEPAATTTAAVTTGGADAPAPTGQPDFELTATSIAGPTFTTKLPGGDTVYQCVVDEL